MKITKKQAKERISFLREEIKQHNKNYYVDNKPVITDFEYDVLLDELKFLENKFPEFFCEDSPTLTIGSDLQFVNNSDNFKVIEHKYPMLSLSNTYDKGSLYSFNERIIKEVGVDFKYVCELKIDGVAISLSYKDGKLVRALTRGDGVKGEDVTNNVLTISGFPRELPKYSTVRDFEIRGEIFMSFSVFDAINKAREINNESLFANPRNAASGSLKLLDSSKVKERSLNIFFYSVLDHNNSFANHSESLFWMREMGFSVWDGFTICNNISEVIDFIDKWDISRKTLDFPTDGVVIKVDNYILQKQLGFTSKSPKWATAYKFKADQVSTKLISIDYQVGRTGAVTPVANLEPVTLSGSEVKRASLHNKDQMDLLDIRLGDYVFVEKGGEIIPKIVGVDYQKRDYSCSIPIFPNYCPDCGTALVKDDDESKHYCPNIVGCPTQIKSRLLHFASKKCMNILIGEATIEEMFSLGLLKDISDFYYLNKDNLSLVSRWKELSINNFLNSVEESKKKEFNSVLFALGIRHIGEVAAKNIANHFISIDNIINSSIEEIVIVDDVGEIMARSLRDFLDNKDNIELINRLKEAGLSFSINSVNNRSNILSGESYVITGVFDISREDLKSLIESHSGKVTSSVSSKCSAVIAGQSPGESKIIKANNLNIPILSKEDLFNKIKING